MALDRTAFDALVSSSGDETSGTVWDKPQIEDVILDPVDAEIARLEPAITSARGLRGTRSTAQSIATATLTKAQLTGEAFDSDGWFDAVTNHRFQPTLAGKYLVTAYVNFENVTSSLLTFYKNGAAAGLAMEDLSIAVANYMNISAADIVTMNGTTDYLELFVAQYTGGARNLIGASFAGIYLGA